MFNIKPEKQININKCVRFPLELIEEIQKQTKSNNITFSKFVILACKYALDNIDKKEL